MNHRIEKLRVALQERGTDAFITESEKNRFYLSGFSGSNGCLVITAEHASLLTDFRYVDQAVQEAKDFAVINNKRQATATLVQQLQTLGVKRVAFEAEHVSYDMYQVWQEALGDIQLVPTSGVVEGIRAIKDEGELAIIREATRIADDAFSHILGFIKPGVTENEIALALEFFMRKQGASGVGFDIIVASGPRGALPHGRATDRVIEVGDMITMDYGCTYKGYNSDLTRTVAVGEPSAKMREIYDIVLRAQCNCVNKIKAGMTCKEADALTRDIIKEAGYGDYYGHSTGHALGLDVHEAPGVSPIVDDVLKAGMVVTVEPGIYVTDLGGVRIEDDVWITENGCEILTKSTKELLILPT